MPLAALSLVVLPPGSLAVLAALAWPTHSPTERDCSWLLLGCRRGLLAFRLHLSLRVEAAAGVSRAGHSVQVPWSQVGLCRWMF